MFSDVVLDDYPINTFPDILSKRSIDLYRLVFSHIAQNNSLYRRSFLGFRARGRIRIVDKSFIVAVLVVGGVTERPPVSGG
jgi:hypothetical protein